MKTDYKKLDNFKEVHGIVWHEPGMDYSANTMGWWEDSSGDIIGQDWHLEEWIFKNYPTEYNEFFTQ